MKNEKNYILKKILMLFNYLVMIIPLLMALALALVYLFSNDKNLISGKSLNYYGLHPVQFSILLIVVILEVYLVLRVITKIIVALKNKVNEKKRCIVISFCIFFVASILRLLFISIFSKDLIPFSDFGCTWSLANGDYEKELLDYYSIFPSYLNFSLFENLIIKIFGNNYTIILYINSIISAGTSVLVYLICKELNVNDKISICVGLVYSLYPSNLVYVSIGTPDFLSLFFLMLGVWILIHIFIDIEKKKKLMIIVGCIGGLSLGISASFKNFSIIIIIAFSIAFLSYQFIEGRIKKIAHLFYTLFIILVILFSYKLSSGVV